MKYCHFYCCIWCKAKVKTGVLACSKSLNSIYYNCLSSIIHLYNNKAVVEIENSIFPDSLELKITPTICFKLICCITPDIQDDYIKCRYNGNELVTLWKEIERSGPIYLIRQYSDWTINNTDILIEEIVDYYQDCLKKTNDPINCFKSLFSFLKLSELYAFDLALEEWTEYTGKQVRWNFFSKRGKEMDRYITTIYGTKYIADTQLHNFLKHICIELARKIKSIEEKSYYNGLYLQFDS